MIKEQEASLHALHEIRDIMARSARFLSLSGWSGVWAGCVALAGSYIARTWLQELPDQALMDHDQYNAAATQFVFLALAVFVVALVGGWYFTWKKTRQERVSLWNNASKKMVAQIAIPMVAGGIFALNFLFERQVSYIAPTCLVFYGLALINGSKYTLSDIRYLGLCQVVLGCICIFVPAWGLNFWAIGFGGLHILYGIVMWNKYKYITKQGSGG